MVVMFDVEIDLTSNKRLLFLRYLEGESKQRGGTGIIYLMPQYVGRTQGINSQTIHSVLTLLENLEHIEIQQKPNFQLPEHVRERRDDEEDYYVLELQPSFFDYLKAIETAASFYVADQIIAPNTGTRAELDFIGITTPIVTTQNTQYKLESMQSSGIPFNIVAYCLHNRPNQTLTLAQLRDGIAASEYSNSGIDSISENIRNSLFGKNNPLNPFIESSPKSILVKPVVQLTDKQLESIIKVRK